MMNQQDREVVESMLRYGGGFVKALAGAARLADSENLRRIKEAWPDYWARYESMAFDEHGAGVHAVPRGRFFIVNDTDRPCERLIAELRSDGLLYYIHDDFRDWTGERGMSTEQATPLEDFGLYLTLALNEDLSPILRGTRTVASVATYSDGRPRLWQGLPVFWVLVCGLRSAVDQNEEGGEEGHELSTL